MRELYIREREACGEDGRPHRFQYYILVDEMEVAEGFACESYGVRITEREAGTQEDVPNITVRAERIDELMELLIGSVVTPISLRDVVIDWL